MPDTPPDAVGWRVAARDGPSERVDPEVHDLATANDERAPRSPDDSLEQEGRMGSRHHAEAAEPQAQATSPAPTPGKRPLVGSNATATSLPAAHVPGSPANPSSLLADLCSAIRALTLADEELEAIETTGDDAHAGILAMHASTLQTRVDNLILELDMEGDAVAAEQLTEIAVPLLDAATDLVSRTQQRIQSVLAREPRGGAGKPLITGEPIVDRHGTVCDGPTASPALDCRLTRDQRRSLLDMLRWHVGAAMNHFSEALGYKYVDLVAAEEKVEWPELVDIVMDALITPAAASLTKALARVAGAESEHVGEIVGGAIKWARGMAKGAMTGVPSGEQGKEMFVRHMANSVGPLGDYIVTVLPPNLDDAGLAALNTYWADETLHSVDTYSDRIEQQLARFEKQVGRIGEFRRDGGDDVEEAAAARLRHRGKGRMALVVRSADFMTKHISPGASSGGSTMISSRSR